MLKANPSDFVVEEELGFEFTDEGEHAYFYVEKCNLNTQEVAEAIARAYGVETFEVGYAGLKDRRAVTRQWFSVPTPEDAWLLDFTCDARGRHRSKLKRGQHAANRFTLIVRPLDDMDVGSFRSLAGGFPNYFGEQRFGQDNVKRAEAWLKTRRERRTSRRTPSRRKEGWHMSVLRSHLFNQVLHRRVQRGDADTILPGDVVSDDVPTGPLWGRGRTATRGQALVIEEQALAPFADICTNLEYAGVQQGRRKLWAAPRNLTVESVGGSAFRLDFALEPGVYATSMLSAVAQIREDN